MIKSQIYVVLVLSAIEVQRRRDQGAVHVGGGINIALKEEINRTGNGKPGVRKVMLCHHVVGQEWAWETDHERPLLGIITVTYFLR